MIRVENRFMSFVKNSVSILTLGAMFGAGHFLSMVILKSGFDDVISMIKN